MVLTIPSLMQQRWIMISSFTLDRRLKLHTCCLCFWTTVEFLHYFQISPRNFIRLVSDNRPTLLYVLPPAGASVGWFVATSVMQNAQVCIPHEPDFVSESRIIIQSWHDAQGLEQVLMFPGGNGQHKVHLIYIICMPNKIWSGAVSQSV